MSNRSQHAWFSQTRGTHLLAPWYEGRRQRRNAAPKEVFRRHEHKAPQREGRQWGMTSAAPFSVSTKDVYGLWTIMWISDQYHAVPQHLTHCPIDRQRKPCNFTGMRLFSEKSRRNRVQIPRDSEDSPESTVRKCADRRGKASPHYS